MLESFEAKRMRGHRPRPGMRIASVRAVGKHLLIEFERRLVLHTHMQMTGSWHLVAAGDRWPKPAHLARVVLGVPGWQAVCFSAPVVETFVATLHDSMTSSHRHGAPGPDGRVTGRRQRPWGRGGSLWAGCVGSERGFVL